MKFNQGPTLENNLVLIRDLKPSDLESLYDVAKDPLIWEQHPCSDRYQRDVFERFFQESIDSKGALLVIEKENNAVIGSSRFNRIDGVDNAIEIGWSFLARKYWGGKYNQAVKKLMIDYAFQFLESVIFYIGPANIRSQKAVEKIGAQRISDPAYKHLLCKRGNFTYLIKKKDWEK